jgi:hypothetical protein
MRPLPCCCVQGLAGPVAGAIVVLWVVYLVPQVLRRRQQLLDSCAEDRYSGRLRVVAVASRRGRKAGRLVRAVADHPARLRPATCARTGATTGLLTPRHGQHVAEPSEGAVVDSPRATTERISADAAREVARVQAGFAAARARRAAGARRRGALAAVLLVAVVVGWALVALLPSTSWLVGGLPTVLLAVVLAAGRAAVVQAQRNDAQWQLIIDEAQDEAAKTGAARQADRPRRTAPRTLGAPTTGTTSTPVPAPRAGSGPIRTTQGTRSTSEARRGDSAARASGTPRPAGARTDSRSLRPVPPRSLGAPAVPASGSGRSARQRAQATSGPLRSDAAASEPVREAEAPAREPRSASGPSRPLADMVTTVLPATPPVGRAIHPSDAATDVFDAIVADRGEAGPSVRHASGAVPAVQTGAERTWSPVVVPPPAYVLKPVVERVEEDPDPVDEVRTTGSIDLDAVLERRRASGL